MAEIPLTRGMVALVDDEDMARVLAKGAWIAQLGEGSAYARTVTYLGGGRSNPVRTSTLMHTFITGWSYVDHRNGDGLDNRRANLRQATHAQNTANKRKYRNNTSGYKGVTRNTGTGRPWRAAIRAENRRYHIGYFDTAEQAARAYDARALVLFGDFARPNFPEEITS